MIGVSHEVLKHKQREMNFLPDCNIPGLYSGYQCKPLSHLRPHVPGLYSWHSYQNSGLITNHCLASTRAYRILNFGEPVSPNLEIPPTNQFQRFLNSGKVRATIPLLVLKYTLLRVL